TFASRLVQSGIDLYVVKELLNHSSIIVTQRYAHLRLENMKKAVEILEKESD
ncbi:MAG: tyrosine-type recombinase/integrase, partial [Brevinematia bacterium]